MAGLTKEQIAERRAAQEAEMSELRTKLLEAEARELEATKRAEWYEARDREAGMGMDVPETVIPAHTEPVADTPVGDPNVFYDPYDSQNPHKILADPPGFKLGWKSPLYRDGHRGWRGWRAVEYDDEIGRNLKRYLLDPPRRMEHAIDNYVRRGDTILCFLDANVWEARQRQRTDAAARRAGEHAKDMRVDRIRTEEDLRPIAPAPNSVGGRSMTS